MKKYLIALLVLIIGLSPLANAYRDLETGIFLTRDPLKRGQPMNLRIKGFF